VRPNPVPWSGQGFEGCSQPNTWYYDQTLRNTGGSPITITERENYFDGTRTSTQGTNYSIPPGGSVNVPTTRWCSANNVEHTARTDWSGSDAQGNRINLQGPPVRLLPR
jgi:hypothetical protein